jgi:hypothetical protein
MKINDTRYIAKNMSGKYMYLTVQPSYFHSFIFNLLELKI